MTRTGLRPSFRLVRPRLAPPGLPDPAASRPASTGSASARPRSATARPGRGTGPLWWLLPVAAAVSGWGQVLTWPVAAAVLGAVLMAGVAGWWCRGPRLRAALWPAGVLVSVLPALPFPGDLLGADATARLLLDAEVTAAGVHLLALAGWAAGLGAVRLAAAGAAVWVRLGPAALILAWAWAVDPQQRLDLPVLAVAAAALAALALPGLPRRRLLPAVTLLATAVAAGGLAQLLPLAGPASAPATVRDVEEVATTDPLAVATGWVQSPPEPAFQVPPGAGTVRWAVLDRYQGVHWDTAGCLPVAAAPAGPGTTVTGNVLPGPWLPVPGDAVAAGEGQLCAGAGGLLAPGPVADYTVWRGDPGRNPAPEPGAVTVTAADRELARALTSGAGAPVGRLERLADRLRAGRFDPGAVPGQERGTLLAVAAGERTGNQAQFASAFALLAAADGHPARVVTGFEPGEQAVEVVQVRTSDVQVWPEVWVDGRWRRFDPQPTTRTPAEQARLQAAPATPEPRATQQQASPQAPAPQADTQDRPTWLPLLAAPLAAVGIAVLVWRRRLAVRRRPPTERIAVAWVGTLRRLTKDDAGHPWQAMTPHQVATAAVPRLPAQADALHTLADLVTRAGYSGQSIHDDDAAGAEQAARRIRSALRRTRKDPR